MSATVEIDEFQKSQVDEVSGAVFWVFKRMTATLGMNSVRLRTLMDGV